MSIERRVDVGAQSAIAHLAMTVWPSRLWGRTILGMFTAAFDASGSEDDPNTPYLVVAGYVSRAERWITFSELWNARLKEDGLTYFRMSEFAQSTGTFDGWKLEEHRRRSLLKDLVDLIKTHAIQMFGCAVKISAMQDMTVETRTQFYITAYALAGMHCAAAVATWSHEGANDDQDAPCTLVYEEGDTGQDALRKRLEEDEFPFSFQPKRDTLRKKTGLIAPGFVPLQAADILAYEVAIGVRDGDFERRWPAVQLNGMPGRIGIYEAEDMPELEERVRASRF